MRRALGFGLMLAVLTTACGGRGGSPTAPSGATTGAGATITGSVQGAAGAFTAAGFGAAITGVTVTVVGTNISATVDAGGRFMLTNVPAGTVQLQFSGGGANATVTIETVETAQTIDVVVSVAGSSASVESEVRSGSGEAQLEGRVESLPPTVAASTFKAAGRTVTTNSSTRFVDGGSTRAFADLRIGMRVHAKGTLTGDTFTAAEVRMQNANTSVPVEVHGLIDTVAGTATSFSFNIGSRVIQGDAQTVFFGSGSSPDSFASLKDGVRVEVKGEQRDGFIYATRIHVNDDDDDDDGEDASASIHGTLSAIGGSAPSLVLTVDGTTVRTSSSTEVKRRGDVQTLAALQLGQSLHVVGTRQSDGSIDARKIEIDDDADGGEFEIEGSMGGLQGSCPAVRFSVNGFAIATSASTTFEDVTCAALKNGTKVNVKGTRQADGSVAAARVKGK